MNRVYRFSIEHLPTKEAHVAVVPELGTDANADRAYASLKNVTRGSAAGYDALESAIKEAIKDADFVKYHIWSQKSGFTHVGGFLPEEPRLDEILGEPGGKGFQSGTEMFLPSEMATVSPSPDPTDEASEDKPEDKESLKSLDNVNHPSHYCKGGIECIDVIKSALSPEEFRGFLRGNVLKYQFRANDKNGLEDIRKAGWYQARLEKELGN